MRKTNADSLRPIIKYFAYLLVIWGFFRFLFKFPDLIEELWFKPLIWLLPLLLMWLGDKKRINFFAGKLSTALLWGLGVGGAYWLILGLLQLNRSGWTGLIVDIQDPAWLDFAGISLATAITEELAFSGYIFSKLAVVFRNIWTSLLLTAGGFTILHIPIGLFIYKYNLYQLSFFLLLVFVVQLGNLYVMSRSRNVLGPILCHWLWGLASFLLV